MSRDPHQMERYRLEDQAREVHGYHRDAPESWQDCPFLYCSIMRTLLCAIEPESSIVFADEPRIHLVKALARVMAFTASESMLDDEDEAILSQHLAELLGPLPAEAREGE